MSLSGALHIFWISNFAIMPSKPQNNPQTVYLKQVQALIEYIIQIRKCQTANLLKCPT